MGRKILQSMISRRNYISITIMMAMVFFLFLFSGAAKVALSHYEINEYDFDRTNFTPQSYVDLEENTQGNILYLGESDTMEQMAQQWCTYRRYRLDVEEKADATYMMVLIDGASLHEENLETLLEFQQNHIPMVFASLPSPAFIREHAQLAEILGITTIQKESVSLSGMTLYDGFLVGGKVIYQAKTKEEKKQQDLNLDIPWFVLASGSKVYMDGILPKAYADTDAAYKPPIVWCYRTEMNTVFAVNNDFMESDIGLGMLSAMEGELSEYYIYPVVNTQNLVAVNYPSFADENSKKLREIYSRDASAVLRDLVWPGIAAVCERNHAYPSVCMTPKYNYDTAGDADGERLTYYQQLLREQHGEAGISLGYQGAIPLEEKLQSDLLFYQTNAKDYSLLFAYILSMNPHEAATKLDEAGYEDVIALLSDYDASTNVLDATDGKVVMQITNTGSSHTYREDLRTKSYQTVLGYSVIGQDFSEILYPESKDDQWEKVFDRFSRYTNTYWQKYDYYDETTITEAARRCNRYMQLDYETEIDSDVIRITSDASEENPAYFIVQTGSKTIHHIDGGSYKKINDGRYLVTVTDQNTTIDCKTKSQLTFWR